MATTTKLNKENVSRAVERKERKVGKKLPQMLKRRKVLARSETKEREREKNAIELY